MKKQNEEITQSGQNQCHITGVIKAYFGHTFHLRPKKDRQAGRQTKKIDLTVRKTERQTRERHQFYRETDKRKTSILQRDRQDREIIEESVHFIQPYKHN